MADYLFGITDPGKERENNEDVFIAEEVMQNQFLIAGVIDGVGGYEGGEVAAALTRDVLLDELAVIGGDVVAQLQIACYLANEEIFAKKLEDKRLMNMACVATIAVIDRQQNLFHYIHVGDTRLYLFRDNSLVKISHDQSPVGFLEDSGRITEDAAMQHPKRNMINQALGLGSREEMSDSYFESGSSPFLPGDLILVCSDGLTDLVNKEEITAVLNLSVTLEEKGKKLVEAANNAGGKDNITIVLAKNDKPAVLPDVPRPAADLFTPFKDDVRKPSGEPDTIAPLVENVESALAEADQKIQEAESVVKEVKSFVVTNPFQTVEPPVPGADLNQQVKVVHKGNKGIIILLSVLCLLFLASTAWLFFTNPPVKLKDSGSLNPVPVKALNASEKLLADTLAKLKGDTLKLTAAMFSTPVRVSKSIAINRDTLFIQTAGDVILQADSGFKGPAFSLAANCKYVVLDQLVLENFETGIVSYKNVLDLKNVRFNHCKYPLQVLFEFPDSSYVNGRVTKRAYQADSLAKK